MRLRTKPATGIYIVPTHTSIMTNLPHAFAEGDRVCAPRRPQFPAGTVLKLMDAGYVLVRWDGDVLETAHYSELSKAETGSSAR